MFHKNAPIGVFDSGLGGISVLKELMRLMPHENFIYLGDSANAPYGTKSAEDVTALSMRNAKLLLDKGCKALVIACNTATSVTIHVLRSQYPTIPIIGIEPALKPAVEQGQGRGILVLATELTLKEERFRTQMHRYGKETQIHCQAAPGIVEFVEQGIVQGGGLDAYLKEILQPFQEKKIGFVVLGCTHFPFVEKAIEKNFHQSITFLDGGKGTARETQRRIEAMNWCNDSETLGVVHILNSANTKKIDKIAEDLVRCCGEFAEKILIFQTI